MHREYRGRLLSEYRRQLLPFIAEAAAFLPLRVRGMNSVLQEFATLIEGGPRRRAKD